MQTICTLAFATVLPALVSQVQAVEKREAGVPGWEPIGKTKPEDRIWRFISFDPQKEEDVMAKTEMK